MKSDTTEDRICINNWEFYQNPYPVLDVIRANYVLYPIMSKVWLSTHYHDISYILKDSKFGKDFISNISIRYGHAKTAEPVIQAINRFMLVKNSPEHGRIRKLVSKAFTPKLLSGMYSFMEEEMVRIILSLNTDKCDLLQHVIYPFSMSVICKMLGFERDQGCLFVREVNEISKLNELRLLNDDEIRNANNSLHNLKLFFEQLCNEKRSCPKDDLISSLLKMEEFQDSFDVQDIWANVILLFIAGHETTVNLIGNSVYSILKDSKIREKFLDADEMESFITEMIRIESSVQVVSRNVLEDTFVGDMEVKKGDVIYLSLGAGNYDPEVFENPYEFRMFRSEKPLSFGGGIHYCLGAQLAKMETEIALRKLFKLLPHIQLLKDHSYEWKGNMTLRGLKDLMVQVKNI